MSSYTGKRFVNPLNKKIGRRTGRDFRAGKNIRVGKDGFENFDDYFSESDADVTREFPRRHASTIREESESASTQESYSDEEYKENQPSHDNIVSQSVPNGTFSNTTYNNMTSSQSLSQGGQNRSKFGWLRNRDIGRRTGKNITANKQIRVDEQGFENFDDYFSESDVSSMSSRLSMSVVKPVPRQSAVSNLVKGDATPSVSLQHSQRHSSADEDESQEDDTDSQTELRDNTQTRAHIPESDTCHETTHTESEEETTIESNKTHSIHKHSDVSENEHVDRTKQSRIYDEDSNVNDEDEEISENRENTTNQMSRSHSHNSQYVETPLSSKRNKSHINGVSDDEYSNSKSISDSRGKYSNSKTSPNNTQTIKVDKNNASRQYESHGDEQSKSGTHKVSIGDHVSEKKIKTLDISKASNNLEHVDTEEDSEVEDEVETEYNSHSNVEAEQFDNDDRDDQDSYDESENETDQDEEDDEHTESDKNEEVGYDDESDANVLESENNTSNKRNRSLAESTADSKHREVRVTGSSTEKVVALTGKSDSRNVTEVQEAEGDSEGVTENESEEYEDDDDLRPSQAQTNIDVAGNKSGSITKLDIPTSVVNFNRTRKRLSYSAGETSEESQQRNKSRIEKANAELFETEVPLKSKEVRGHFQSIPTKDSTRNTNIVNSSKKVKDSETHADQSSEFLSLASRSTLPQQTQDIDDSEEDDIMVLDYDRPKVTVGNGRNKSTRDKAKSQVIHLDTDSQSESEKQANTKNVKQGSKSEIKKVKPQNNAKGRRKTTHGSNKVNGLSVNLNFKKQNKKNVTDFEDQNLCEDGNDENHVENDNCDVRANISNVDENINDNVSENTTSNKSNETASKSRKKKEQKQTIKSGAVKESRQMKKSTKSDKTQSTDDDDNETRTTGTNLKTADETSGKEDERNTDESEETESSLKKQKTKQTSKKTNKRKNASGKNVKSSDSVNEGKDSRKKKISRKEIEASSDNDLDDNNTNDIAHHEESPGDESQAKGKVVKKQKGKSLTENEQLESKRESKHAKNSGKIANETISNKKLKRKSSSDMSDDCLADDSGREFQTKKAKKSIQRKSKGGKRKTSQKTVSSSSSDNGEVFETEDVTDHSKPMVDESAGRTPTVDSRLSVPSHFGSGVSFRVSRRSELLADVGSGYVGEGTVHTEPTGGLTPCISRPGAARKSKGRRVTICPEENIEHNISGDKSSDENSRNNHFRWSTGTSVNATPLPDPDSTPVHYCETTHTATPGGKAEESVIEDRLIKPSPPEEGLRRSQRTRLKPIAWYKNEQVVFDYRRRSGPAIVGVKPSLEVKWNKLEEARRKKRLLRNQIRKAARPEKEDKPYRKLSIHKPLPNDIEVEEDQDPEITVFNQCLQAEDGIDCIGKRDAFKPVGPTHETPRKEDPYIVTKLLDHPCMSAGKLHIKPNAEKPEQLVTGDYTLFFIEYGKMLVKLHKTSFLVETGDTFMVPIGNTYSISNLRADTAKLFYTVHKEVDDDDKSETPQLT